MTVYSAPIARLGLDLTRLRCVDVTTASDKVFRGTSSALAEVASRGQVPAPTVRTSRRGAPGWLSVADFHT